MNARRLPPCRAAGSPERAATARATAPARRRRSVAPSAVVWAPTASAPNLARSVWGTAETGATSTPKMTKATETTTAGAIDADAGVTRPALWLVYRSARAACVVRPRPRIGTNLKSAMRRTSAATDVNPRREYVVSASAEGSLACAKPPPRFDATTRPFASMMAETPPEAALAIGKPVSIVR